jgi:hypothetical protein
MLVRVTSDFGEGLGLSQSGMMEAFLIRLDVLPPAFSEAKR